MDQRPNEYRVRWRFEYKDRLPKYGMWDTPGDFPSEQAWSQSKENLTRAVIQGKHWQTKQIVDLASVDGHDFVNFQWIASAAISPMVAYRGPTKLPKRIIGLMLVARNHKYKVFVDGNVKPEKHNIDYSRVNLRGFGR